MEKYPKIVMKVNKNLYLEDSLDKGNKNKFKWSTVKKENVKETVVAGRFLLFRSYWYGIINPVTEDDKKNSMLIIMNIIDKLANQNYPLGSIEIHPYELNELIKENAIEII